MGRTSNTQHPTSDFRGSDGSGLDGGGFGGRGGVDPFVVLADEILEAVDGFGTIDTGVILTVIFVISGSALLYVVNTLWDKKPVVAG